MTIARLVPWKGIDRLIEIFPHLNSGTRLIIVGDGPDISRLEDLVYALSVDKRVIFTGRIPLNKISLYLKAADVFVLPSSYEGLPHTILEAMLVGTPVVATDIGGISELIEDGKDGLLFAPRDLSGLEESISKILKDKPAALHLVENAKGKARQFNVDISDEKIIGILDSLTNNRVNQYNHMYVKS